jgi:hypothetical protein
MAPDVRCGSAAGTVVVCAWADPGGVGLVRFQRRDVVASEALFQQLRDGI